MQIALRNDDKDYYSFVVVILSLFNDVFFHFRAHLNDLENIPTFLIIALLFMLAGLCPTRGIWCLRIFTAARIVHTLSYLSAFSMPRGAGFLIGVVCTIVLGVSVLLSAAHAGSFWINCNDSFCSLTNKLIVSLKQTYFTCRSMVKIFVAIFFFLVLQFHGGSLRGFGFV